MSELKPYNPSLRDRLAAFLMGNGRASPERRAFVQGALGSTGLGTTGAGLADFVPGGQALAFDEAVRSGDYQGAGLAIMPLPGAKLTPAVKVGNKVYRGKDHFAALADMMANVPPELKQEATRAWYDGAGRGFINDKGRFLNRERAQAYALENELLSPDAPEWARTSPHLIAENLNPEAFDIPSRARRLAGALTQAPRHIPGKPDSLKIPDIGIVEAAPIKELQDSADKYMASVGRPGAHRIDEYPEFDDANARRIAEAFERMKHDPSDPEVKRAYDAMIAETLAQYRSIKDTGLDIQFIPEGMRDPYAASPALGYADIIENGHLWTFPTDQGFGTLNTVEDNPLLKRVGRIGDLDNATANDAFRVVHDLYGHFAPGNPFFRHKGEERAWVNHSQMYSDEARPAMTTETRGQNSWLNFGPYGDTNRSALSAETTYADQKIGLLPKWAQEIVKKYGFAGLSGLPVSVQLALALQRSEAEPPNGED